METDAKKWVTKRQNLVDFLNCYDECCELQKEYTNDLVEMVDYPRNFEINPLTCYNYNYEEADPKFLDTKRFLFLSLIHI